MQTGWRRRLRDIVLASGAGEWLTVREDLARRYLRGEGIEIGAFCWPLRVPPGARVRYVDSATKAELLATAAGQLTDAGMFPESIPETDVVDSAETLATFADASLDFVIANHVIEHVEDPIGALETMLRVLRPGGVLFVALPDARHSFDKHRVRTSVEHVLRDHREGPEWSRRGHYEEWATYVEGYGDVDTRAAQYAAADVRNHFHCWELEGFLDLLSAAGLPARLAHAQVNGEEFIVVLRRD